MVHNMASRLLDEQPKPGDALLVIHDFNARSPDELSLKKGDRIELIERDDDFGDGWFLGRHLQNGTTGLFPEVYTTPAPRGTLSSKSINRIKVQPPVVAAVNHNTPDEIDTTPSSLATQVQHSLDSPKDSPPPTTSSSPELYRAESAPPPASAPPTSTSMNASRLPVSLATQRSRTLSLAGGQDSPVMNETLNVIDEHITDMNTPRHSIVSGDRRGLNDSGSEYSTQVDHRLSYINGHETDEEEQNQYSRKEVMAWSPARVAEYLEEIGVERKHCEVFCEQEISGEVLLVMEQDTLFLKELDLGPVGRRLRTWHKIKAFQQEIKISSGPPRSVSDYSGVDETGNEAVRNRGSSFGTVLPRIPSLSGTHGLPPTGRSQTIQRMPSQISQTNQEPSSSAANTGPIQPLENPRPSAASVRSMNHSRRHSSFEYVGSIASSAFSDASKPYPPPQASHKKEPSFDRGWTMVGSQAQTNGRPASTVDDSFASNGTRLDANPRELDMTVVNALELDRGYFSGGEVENRKSRQLLRKKDSAHHSAHSSISTDPKRRTVVHSRAARSGSGDSFRDSIGAAMSPAAKAYYSTSPKKDRRTASGPEFGRKLHAPAEVPPTVTKLDYGDSPSIDAVALSPSVNESDASSTGVNSPVMQKIPKSPQPLKTRGFGLRAISDAVTGNERALALKTSDASSPSKESPLQSPGSSTPSATSKSFEGDSNSAKTPTSAGGSVSGSVAARRKSKKHTSAYTRGLEKKSPAEQMEGCDYSGWMKKRSSNLMTTWKSRLFVLRGCRLSYYYSENDKEERGLIDISSHRVLPADNERLTGLHASLTRATVSPTSPPSFTLGPAIASTFAASIGTESKISNSGIFIFKLVPPRSGLSKAVNFTKPTVHYFAVDSIQQGRLWMAALMKATIDRDEMSPVITTYQQKTISLAKAKATKQRPPALMNVDEEGIKGEEGDDQDGESGLAITGLDDGISSPQTTENGVQERSGVETEVSSVDVGAGGSKERIVSEVPSAAAISLPPSTRSRLSDMDVVGSMS